jgi:VRR-NUC domain-containing protein
MLRFPRSGSYWWRKPLVKVKSRALPAELAVLARELRPSERGVWVNSRPKASGVVDLVPVAGKGTFETRREPLPLFVVTKLEEIYVRGQLQRGCPDLVIWRTDRDQFRLVEVKCPEWDKPSKDQRRFIEVASELGIDTSIVEWRFREDAA